MKSTVLPIKPKLKPDCTPIRVFCDMKLGGYTVIQRRTSDELDFYRNWTEYKGGFGDAAKDYWIGLDNLHYLTHEANNSLRIELEDWHGQKKTANYESFSIGAESDGYQLTVKDYSGDAGDALNGHVDMKFSTYDVDNDQTPPEFWSGNCAKRFNSFIFHIKYNDCQRLLFFYVSN